MEKNIPPTRKRLEKASLDGDTLRCEQFISCCVYFVSVSIIANSLIGIFTLLSEYMVAMPNIVEAGRYELLMKLLEKLCWSLFSLLCQSVGVGLLVAVCGHILVQHRVSLSLSRCLPSFSRLTLRVGFARILSFLSEQGDGGLLYRTSRALIGLCLGFIIIASVMSSWLDSFRLSPVLFDIESRNLPLAFCEIIQSGILRMLAVFAFLAVADALVYRWRRNKRLSMTFKEYVDEIKELEGNPHIRALRHSMQKEIAYNDMMQGLRDSKVLLVAE